MPAGRPSKYKPEMCQELIDIMSEGASLTEACVKLEICDASLRNWKNPEHPGFQPDFLAAVKKGKEKAKTWWEAKVREGTFEEGKYVNPTLAIFQMKNRFREDYGDISRHEVTGKDGGAIETKDATGNDLARRLAFIFADGVKSTDESN